MSDRELLLEKLCPTKGDHGSCNRCHDHGNCRVVEKTVEQLAYIFSSVEESVFLKACPGSGKTEVVAMKAAYEVSHWNKNGGIAFLSFTRNAADVIKDRVSDFTGLERLEHPHFIGTFDSWLHSYIAHPFLHMCTGYNGKENNDGDRSYRIISEKEYPNQTSDNSKLYLRKFELKGKYVSLEKNKKGDEDHKLKYLPMWVNNVRWEDEWEIICPQSQNASFISVSDYCKREAVREHNKRNPYSQQTAIDINNDINAKKRIFRNKGYATYNDMERLCLGLLQKQKNLMSVISDRFPLIIVDEAQDLSSLQLKILGQLKEQGSYIHFVGDLKQAIYEFKKVDPLLVDEFADESSMRPMPLTNNFRSNQNIVNFTNKIIATTDGIKGNQQVTNTPCFYVIYPKAEITKVPMWFKKHLEKYDTVDLKKSAIITRGRTTISKMRPSASYGLKPQHEFALALKMWGEGDDKYIHDAIELMGKCISKTFFDEFSSTSSQYYKPSIVSKTSDWRTFLANVLIACVEDGKLINLNSTWSQWAENVRNKLKDIIWNNVELLEFLDNEYKFDVPIKLKFQVPRTPIKQPSLTDQKVIDTLGVKEFISTELPIKTIHAVKGETLDAVMLVSSPTVQGKDGYWEKWLEDSSQEAARFAYVASSRPRQVLVWAVPEGADENKLKDRGLKPADWNNG